MQKNLVSEEEIHVDIPYSLEALATTYPHCHVSSTGDEDMRGMISLLALVFIFREQQRKSSPLGAGDATDIHTTQSEKLHRRTKMDIN
jgi:hypothetical protein